MLATLDAEVHFEPEAGRFVGAGNDVECTRLDDRLAVYGTNCSEEGGCWFGVRPQLNIQAQANEDVVTPLDLLDCRFIGSEVPAVEDFDIVVIDASAMDFVPLDPLPSVGITLIACDGATVTTTSTTLADPCSDVTCPAGEVCKDGACRTATAYEIDFSFATAEELGALQYNVFYDCREGGIVGERFDTRCTPNRALNAHSSFNDRFCGPASPDGYFTAVTTSIVGFAGPIVLATCEFESTTGNAPTAADFTIEVVDASDPDLHPVAGTRVEVDDIRAIAR